MDNTLLIIIIIGFALIGAIIVWGINSLKKNNSKDDTAFLMLQQNSEALRTELTDSLTKNMALVNQQLDTMSRVVSEEVKGVKEQLNSSSGQINDRLTNAGRVIGEVQVKLGELSTASERIFDVGKDIASLQHILKAPKLRGELGEFFLGDLLSQILPESNFKLQYGFKKGTKVDAAIFLSEGIVSVDSKFSLENFVKISEADNDKDRKAAKRRFISDVKKRIDEIAGSYILPDEGTFDFALMYIPAENVYYETIIKDEEFGGENSIAEYAFTKRVIPVSPNSFYSYLQTIVMGLRGMEISKEAKTVMESLQGLKVDFNKFLDDYHTLGKHLTNAKGKYEDGLNRTANFSDKLEGAGRSLEGTVDKKDSGKKELNSDSQQSLIND